MPISNSENFCATRQAHECRRDSGRLSATIDVIDNMIGPRNAIAGEAVKDQDFMRLFDPATKLLIFRGEPFDVQALATSLEGIKTKASARIAVLEANECSGRQTVAPLMQDVDANETLARATGQLDVDAVPRRQGQALAGVCGCLLCSWHSLFHLSRELSSDRSVGLAP